MIDDRHRGGSGAIGCYCRKCKERLFKMQSRQLCCINGFSAPYRKDHVRFAYRRVFFQNSRGFIGCLIPIAKKSCNGNGRSFCCEKELFPGCRHGFVSADHDGRSSVQTASVRDLAISVRTDRIGWNDDGIVGHNCSFCGRSDARCIIASFAAG